MSRRAVGALLALALCLPASADRWRKLAEGDGYTSSTGTVRASLAPQPPQKVLAVAKAFMGIPYVWAGNQPSSGFDCSGYAYEVMRLNGYEIPRMADQQFEETRRVKYTDLRPGDLVFFQTYLPGPSHVGFFLGEGKFIHASSAAEGVVVSRLDKGYYRERFLGGGRPEGWPGMGTKEISPPQRVSKAVASAQPAAPTEVRVASPAGPSVAQEMEKAAPAPLSTSPFARRRAAASSPVAVPSRPVIVAAVPSAETTSELAWEEWKLVLGETLATGRLRLQAWMRSLLPWTGHTG